MPHGLVSTQTPSTVAQESAWTTPRRAAAMPKRCPTAALLEALVQRQGSPPGEHTAIQHEKRSYRVGQSGLALLVQPCLRCSNFPIDRNASGGAQSQSDTKHSRWQSTVNIGHLASLKVSSVMPRRNAAVQFRKSRHASKKRPKHPPRARAQDGDGLPQPFDLVELDRRLLD